MKLRGSALKTISEAKGVSREQLAAAIERVNVKGDKAMSAINNWFNDRDHPRARAEDVRKLAAALGVAPKDICRFTTNLRNHRGSPRKAKLLVDMIRGKKVDVALNMLTFTTKSAAINVKKALNAAIADAEQADADVTQLVVVESRVDEGPRMKRFQPKDRGRAHSIIKRFSHITIGVEEKAGR
jgi:large subunit ribosomal protein L22